MEKCFFRGVIAAASLKRHEGGAGAQLAVLDFFRGVIAAASLKRDRPE